MTPTPTTPETPSDPLAAARAAAARANCREPAFWWLFATMFGELWVLAGAMVFACSLAAVLVEGMLRGNDRIWGAAAATLAGLGFLVGCWAAWRLFRSADAPRTATLRGAAAAAAFSAVAVGAAVVVPAWALHLEQIDVAPELWRVGTVSLAIAVNHAGMFCVADRVADRIHPVPAKVDDTSSL